MNLRQKGFTLIELLTVIAIIGIMSSVVLANLQSSREKARDTKRVADIKNLQLALALYFDINRKYPGALLSGAGELAPTYIPVIPSPPSGVSGVASYIYVPLNPTCNGYHLGAALEQFTNVALADDSDAAPGAVASPAASACATSVVATSDFHGGSGSCSGSSAGTDKCFDVTP